MGGLELHRLSSIAKEGSNAKDLELWSGCSTDWNSRSGSYILIVPEQCCIFLSVPASLTKCRETTTATRIKSSLISNFLEVKGDETPRVFSSLGLGKLR